MSKLGLQSVRPDEGKSSPAHRPGCLQIRVPGSELVVHADAQESGAAAAIADRGIGSGRQHAARGVFEDLGPPALAGIDVETFELDRPVIGEGVFDTAADGPAGIARRVAGQRVGVQAAIGQTAGDVDQGSVEGVACLLYTSPSPRD